MDRAPALDLLVFLVTAIGGGIAVLVAFAAWRGRRVAMARTATIVALAIVALYAVALAAVSTGSAPRRLAPGEVKRFCGFYLDCHLGASVAAVTSATRLGEPGRESVARGRFLVVTLRLASDARQATLTPYGITAVVVDSAGRRYPRALAVERTLGRDAGVVAGFAEPIPAGGSFTRRLVFDVPRDVRSPSLLVTEEAFPDSWIERVLIGDEDSLLHPPTLLTLAVDGPTAVLAR